MNYELIIIGAGPGGYEMAAEAAACGLNVAIVERDLVGGTCLNRGCIPTKALCRNAEVVNLMRDAARWGVNCGDITVDYSVAHARKDEVVKQLRDGVQMLLSQPGITLIEGEARFTGPHTIMVGDQEHTGKSIVIATGSAPRGLPIEGADLAMTSDDVLAMSDLPKSMCIVGGGVIGMEFAAIFSSFGVEVTVVEFCKEILPPFDKDIAKRLKQVLSKRGIKVITQAAVKSLAKGDDGITVTYDLKARAARRTRRCRHQCESPRHRGEQRDGDQRERCLRHRRRERPVHARTCRQRTRPGGTQQHPGREPQGETQHRAQCGIHRA